MTKKYKKWVPPVVSYVPPPPRPIQAGGMRMEMRPIFSGDQIANQRQIMKLSPRVRDKPLSESKRAKLFKFRGRKTNKE